jgi:Mn2+/Fe2+ NRAMP family transporter
MANSIEPLRQGDLPEMKKGFWRLLGPGAIMVGLAIGSGELVLWPWITARFGAVMAWAPVLAIFLQCWINLEIGRWAIATGESALSGLARSSVKIIYLFMAFLFVMGLMPGWARATAATIRFLLFGFQGPWPEASVWGTDWLWSIPVGVVVLIVLLGPKNIYSGMETVVTVLVVMIFVGLIVVAAKIGTMQHAKELASGIVSFPPKIQLADDFPFLRFFGALVFAGCGGFGNLFYAYYLRDKGIGMGKRFPMLAVDIRGKQERSNETGYLFPDTPENKQRFRDWLSYITWDTTLFFGLTSVITLCLFLFAALVALYPQEQGFADKDLVWSLSGILGSAMGIWGRYLFLLVAIAALFSTVVTNADGATRLWTDLFHSGFPSTKRWSAGRMYAPIIIAWLSIGTISTWYFETHQVSILDFFFINAVLNGMVMAIYTPVMLHLNLRQLPSSARPGPINIFFVGCGALLYIAFSIYLIGNKVGLW